MSYHPDSRLLIIGTIGLAVCAALLMYGTWYVQRTVVEDHTYRVVHLLGRDIVAACPAFIIDEEGSELVWFGLTYADAGEFLEKYNADPGRWPFSVVAALAPDERFRIMALERHSSEFWGEGYRVKLRIESGSYRGRVFIIGARVILSDAGSGFVLREFLRFVDLPAAAGKPADTAGDH
ncbi:MAG: hypothetical protein IPM18_15755 [Phycisphaerales bacterium]|nr:hypothetical protein [Phycisphaerales bacterium]